MIRGKVVLNSDRFLILKTTPMGIGNGLIGSVYAQDKETGRLAKAKFREKLHLMTVIGELVKSGVAVPSEDAQFLLERFAEAILDRSSACWQTFFRTSAAELVRLFG